jgi:protein NRD1
MTDMLPHLMADLVQSAPDTQKEKITKLLDIWQRGHTFPLDMIATFKKQLNGGQTSKSSGSGFGRPLPDPSPLDAYAASGGQPQDSGTGQAPSVQTNLQPTAPPASVPTYSQVPQDSSALLAALSGYGQQNVQTNAPPAAPTGLPFLQNMVPPPPPPGFVPPPPAVVNNGQPAMPPPPAGMHDLAGQILQAMSTGSIPPEQAIQVLSALAAAQNGGTPFPPPQPAAMPQVPQHTQMASQNGAQQERRDQNGVAFRDRSRSPDYHRRGSPNRKSPPNRRESPTYGVYDPNSAGEGNGSNRFERERGRGRGKGRGGRNERNEYRQRTPPPPRRQPSPPRNAQGQTKFLDWDASLPRDNIRVLSRTLFVGGAGGTEGEIRDIFSRFGKVQTCIVNQDKRHAFVKMMTRPDAVAAKEGMDTLQDPAAQSKARQVRFYPRHARCKR